MKSRIEKNACLSSMGVKDFYKVLKDVCPQVLQQCHLSELCGYKIAVDISIFLYKFVRTSGPERWIDTFILLLCALKQNGIQAVCIFDGPNPPTEKRLEQERRRKETEKIRIKLKRLQKIHKDVKENYLPTERELSSSLANEVKTLIGTLKDKKSRTLINYDDVFDVEESMRIAIERYERQTLPITPEYAKRAKELISCIGLAQFQAEGEAETLCAYLAITKQVDAVLSEDTDVLAYGTPLLLSKIDLVTQRVGTLFHKNIRSALGFSVNEVRDLCILLSCDYNSRVKGYIPECALHETHRKCNKPVGIGAKGALCMIAVYRTLEEVEKRVVDADPLNYRRCRQLFTVPSSIPFAVVPYNKPIDKDSLETFLSSTNSRIKTEYILSSWQPPKLIFDSNHQELEKQTLKLQEMLEQLEKL